MKKSVEITIQHAHAGRLMSQKAHEEWEFRMKALELALRMNPALVDEFQTDDAPVVMY